MQKDTDLPFGRSEFLHKSGFQIDAGLFVEHVANVASKVELHHTAGGQSAQLLAGHIHSGDDHPSNRGWHLCMQAQNPS